MALVNDSDYGLHAGSFMDSLHHAMRAWRERKRGGVIVNDVPCFGVNNMPQGGFKLSGLGREGICNAIADTTEPRRAVMYQG